SILVSYARARAEALGLRGDVGIGSRAERVVVITAGLVLAPWGVLPWAILVLGATAWITVCQRVLHVRRQLRDQAPESAAYPASTSVLAADRKGVLVRMPGELKRLLSEEAASTGRSLNDVAVGILAARFAVPFEPSGRPGKPAGRGGAVLLRMPAELKRKLGARATQRSRNLNDLIVETLTQRLGKEEMAATNGSSNGRARGEDKVRVAIVGVGNCANSLLQGVEYYKDAPDDQFVPGLMHVNLGGYHVRDVEFVAAFDVVEGKVGVDLAEAIWAHPNNTIRFADVQNTGVKGSRGMTHDGLGKYLSQVVEKAPGETADVVGILRERNVDVVVNYLPVGSEEATKWYAEQVLAAGCAMVNCMPVFIAREPYWQRRVGQGGAASVWGDIKTPGRGED